MILQYLCYLYFDIIPDILRKTMKKWSTVALDNPFKSIPAIKVQQNIDDRSRKVTDYHYCRSQPKTRNQPKLYGLSKSAFNLIGINYEAAKADPLTAEYLSGSKLLPSSEVTINICSPLLTIIVDTNSEYGQVNLEMEGLIYWAQSVMKENNMNFSSREVESLLFLVLQMAIAL